MNLQELEARLNARIMSLAEEECRMREMLESLRQIPVIAAEWQAHDRESVTDSNEELAAGNRSDDILDTLRRRLASKAGEKSRPSFSSRILSKVRVTVTQVSTR